MTSPVRRMAAIPELPEAIDPANDNQLTRRGYVNGVALPTGGSTDYILCKDAAGDRKGKWLPPHLASAPILQIYTGAGGGNAYAVDAGAYGGLRITMSVTGGLSISVPTNGFDGLPIHWVIYNNVGSAQTITLNASFQRLGNLAASFSLPAGKIARVVARRTDVTGSAVWIVESYGVTQ